VIGHVCQSAITKDNWLDVLLLCETWHDADLVSIDRLHTNGHNVVERARPHRLEVSMGVNHGGVAIAAVAGVRLKAVNVGIIPSTFEYVAARISSGQSSCLVVVVYRPGSSVVTDNFFAELAHALDCLSTSVDLVVLAGDINTWLDRASDTKTVAFGDFRASYGLTQVSTHIEPVGAVKATRTPHC